MGLLDKIFGSRPSIEKTKIDWIHLTETSQLEIISKSIKPVGIFKHSTRCGTSRFIKRQFEASFELDSGRIDMYYLDLLSYRDISNELASKYNIRHESPQLIIIKKGKVVVHNSHAEIYDVALEDYL